MTNTKALKIAMAMHGESQTDLANAIGLSPSQLSVRINNKLEFSQGEIEKITKHYSLTGEDVVQIFLT